MKKVIISFLLFIGTIFAANIYVENISVSSDTKEILFPVKISSSEKFSGFQFNIFFNREILDFDGFSNGEIVSDFNVLVNEIREGFIKVAGFSPSLQEVSGEGTLFYIKFSVKKAGRSFVSITGVKLSDKNGKKVNCSAKAGFINVEGDTEGEKEGTENIPSSPPSTSSTSEYSPTFSPSDEKNTKNQTHRTFRSSPRTSPSYSFRNTDTGKEKVHTITQGNFNIPSNNCVLLVLSEYGNPSPPSGFTTFNKGENVICKVEKEIPISEMEKVVCTGYEGQGSVGNGSSNFVSFRIEKDSKIIWKWKKEPMEQDFNLKYDKKIFIPHKSRSVVVPVFCQYYGGVKEKIKFQKEKLPDGIEIEFPEISYNKKQGDMKIKINNLKVGNYTISFSAFPENKENLKKLFKIVLSVEGQIKIIKKQENSKTTFIFASEKIPNLRKFYIEISKDKDMKVEKIEPENVDVIIRKNSIAVAGNGEIFEKLKITMKGKSDIKIEKALFIDKNGEPLKLKLEI